jgi:hypothetical protein
MNLELLIICGVLVMCVVAWLVQRRPGPIRLDQHGVLIARSPSKPVYLRWEDIESFGVASVSKMEGGLYQPGFTQFVGVRLSDVSPMKSKRACADNRRLSDYDVLLTPDRGRKVDEFAAYLEEERRKFRKG